MNYIVKMSHVIISLSKTTAICLCKCSQLMKLYKNFFEYISIFRQNITCVDACMHVIVCVI